MDEWMDGWWGLMKEESVNYTPRSRPLYHHSLIAAPWLCSKASFLIQTAGGLNCDNCCRVCVRSCACMCKAKQASTQWEAAPSGHEVGTDEPVSPWGFIKSSTLVYANVAVIVFTVYMFRLRGKRHHIIFLSFWQLQLLNFWWKLHENINNGENPVENLISDMLLTVQINNAMSVSFLLF